MKIRRHKNLIREIAPGEIVIGNNPFAPTLKLDELTRKAELDNNTVLVEPDLLHISGKSINYETLSIISGSFENRPQAENRDILLEGDLDPDLNELRSEDISIRSDLQNASGILNDQIINESQTRQLEDHSLSSSILLSSGILDQEISNLETDLITASGILDQEISNLETDLITASGILNQEISDLETESQELNTKINQASGDLATQIENIELEGGAVTYQQASDLAKKWAIILG